MPTASAAPIPSRSQRIGARVGEIAALAAVIVALVSTGTRRTRSSGSFRSDAGDVQLDGSGDIRLYAGGTLFEIAGRTGAGEEPCDIRVVRDARGVAFGKIEVNAVVDGASVRITADRPRTTPEGPTHAAAHVVLRGPDRSYDGDLGFTLIRSPPAMLISLKLRSVQPHQVALVLGTNLGRLVPFVRGTGLLVDVGHAEGPTAIFESPEQAAAIGGTSSDMSLRVGASEDEHGALLSATMTLPAGRAGEAVPAFILTGASPSAVTEAAARVRKEPVRRLRGRVVGGDPGVDVWGVGAEGRPLLHVKSGTDGRFEVVAPPTEIGFYATMEHTRASPIVQRSPRDNSELELTMLPGGEAHVRVEDLDTGKPLTARLIVHGIAPTADPNFGPDYRASGAGPLIDALRGEANLPLPSGRYRIIATRGPEYTIDEQPIDIGPGSSIPIRLELRHIVESTGWVGCDFHVHARPSFDSPVLPEDRVLSLVAAGVEFAVPSEHNAVGHYEPALEALELTRELATVPGVEITTARPSLGHFNVFPYAGPQVPPWRKTSVRTIFAKAKEGDPSRVLQVNHPRLAKGIGYFDIVGLDTKSGTARGEWRPEFDSLEVYNGFDNANRDRAEAVLMDWIRLLELGHKYVATGDSDSHRIQYQWAGYPRTYVQLPLEQSGDTGAPIDKTALIASLKAGHAFVTSGPALDAKINGKGPGHTVVTHDRMVRLHVVVRAAPWIDVSEVEVMVGATSITRVPVAAAPRNAPPVLDLDVARKSTIRVERDFDVPFDGHGTKFVVVIVRGTRAMDDVLPYMPIQPLAFTNPIWLKRP
jgi:hypothetical protein